MVHTRRSAGPTGPDRSLLQLERDHIASSMDFTWPPVEPGRPNENSRGIETNGSTCYQVSVLQTLLHQPPFLRWILSHHTAQVPCAFDDCTSCYVKQLVEEYWDSSNPNTAVQYLGNDPEDIDVEACSSVWFTRFVQEDAALFCDWLIQAIFECGTRDVGAATGRSYGIHWKSQVETLFRINLQGHDTCVSCGYQTLGPLQNDWILNLGVVGNTTIQQAITGALDEQAQKRCPRCGQNATGQTDRRRRIVAAPKTLCCRFLVLFLAPTGKIYHTLNYPEILDLTNRQEINQLQLRYRLTGVVSHRGEGADNGHFIASVRGRQDNQFTCISDDEMAPFNLNRTLANPMRPPASLRRLIGTVTKKDPTTMFQAYMLMYERDDATRQMPVRPGKDGGKKRLRRELRSLQG